MAIKFNIEPYWDDFNQATTVDGLSPKEKYNKILFRPGHAIQARELTQLQSQLQNQISSQADHIFKDGSVVVPGEITVHNRIDYLKVTTSVTPLSDFVGKEINDGTNYAKVIHVVAATATDPITLFVKYVSGSSKFAEGASLTGTSLSALIETGETSNDDSWSGLGSLVSISEGIYYIKKHFVIVKPETLILEKYTANVSYDVGFTVTETLIDSSTDSSLVDNAQGTPNKSAPGAHRYSIKTTLSKRDTSSTTGNFILLVRLEGGAIVKSPVKNTQYNIIGDTMARRTFDESGNYTVNPFPVSIKNHATDTTKLIASVEPSKAYVQGFEIETTSVININIDKSRSSELATDKVVQIETNNYIDISSMESYPNTTTFELINIKNGSSIVATVRVRSIVGLGESKYRLHVFDYQPIAPLTITNCTLAGTINQNFVADIEDANLGSDTLVFPLPINRVKTCNSVTDSNITTTDFNYRFEANRIMGTYTVSSGQAVFSGATSDETIGSKSNLNNWVLIDNDNYTVITLTEPYIDVDNPVSGASTVTITGLTNGAEVTLIAPVIRTLNHKIKTKTATTSSTQKVFTFNSSVDFHQYEDLAHSDVLDLTSVVDSNSVVITDNFEVVSGATGSYYGHGKIKLKSTSNYVVSGNITVNYNYFTHSTGDFFTVDSYSSIDYVDIPTFENIELRSAVDFRPRMADDVLNFTSTNASTSVCPIPNSQFETDIQYYLDRIDKIFINKDGILDVVYGVPSLNPKKPESPKDSIILYELYVRAYTLSPEEVILTFIDNKRYTMRDIGKIEKRVNNLEYYTTLSLLETEANALQVLNPEDGTLRFKSGFLVDSFKSTRVGRTSSPEYKAGIDPLNGSLRPLFSEGNAKLLYESDTSTTVTTGDLITIPYENTALITQTQSSGIINVNPYSVFNWTGTIKLSPHSDEWKDIDRRPTVMLNNDGVYNALLQTLQGTTATGTVWGSWETNWVGTEDSSTTVSNPTEKITTTTTTTTKNQIRSGVATSVETGTVISNIGDRQVSIAFRPFIRSRVVKFEATLLRPDTRVYAFFDGVDVSDWVRAYNSADTDPIPLVGPNSETVHPLGSSTLTTDSNGAISGTFFIPNNSSINFSTGQREFILVDSPTPETTSTVTTFASSAYYAKGVIETVENVILSTRTPYVHKTSVSDARIVTSRSTSTSSIPQPKISPPISSAHVPQPPKYRQGSQTNATPYEPEEFSSAFSPNENWSADPRGEDSRDSKNTSCGWKDPLAQSFLIDMAGGVMVTALDLYFTSADDNIPVSVSIRTMLNGSPTQTIVPYSETTLNPYDGTTRIVKIDGNATRFWFESPVYLQENVEYCFVVDSNSDAYNVKFATQGLEDDDGDLIIKQPYNGVMFKSQNASTWTEDQTSDLTFVLHRAVFEIETTFGLVLSNEELPKRSLFDNPFSTVTGDAGVNTVTVSHYNHGMLISDYVVIAGASATNGITTAEINATHEILSIKRNSYTIEITTGGAVTPGTGGENSVSATQNLAFNILHPIVQSMIFPGTSMGWGIKDTIEGESAPSSNYTSIVPNSNYYPQSAMSIKSGSTPSLILSGAMYTNKNNISPVVDMTRCSVITISNIIDENTDVAETDKSNGSALAKYVTKTVQLDNPSNVLKVYLDTNKPKFTNIIVYYKIGSDAGTFDNTDWIELVSTVPFSDDINVYKEVEYNLDDVDEFTMFAIKIVFTSSKTFKIPSVRNLRVIALV